MTAYHSLAAMPSTCVDDVFLGVAILVAACVVVLVYLGIERAREERHGSRRPTR